MEELLASSHSSPLQIIRGQEITGEVVSITDREIVLDLGAKSEGVISPKDIPPSQKENLKIGDKIKAFVISEESDSGQIVLSIFKASPTLNSGRFGKGKSMVWDRFISIKNQKAQISGKILEINKGGLIIEVDGIRGFLPSSLISSGLSAQVGFDIRLLVSEVDHSNNRLIFTQKGLESNLNLKEYKQKQTVVGEVVNILPFGLVVKIEKVWGIVFIGEVSWEKVEDLTKDFKPGQKIESQIINVEEDLGRLNLSLKNLSEDPFESLSSKIVSEDTIKGTVSQVTPTGLVVALEGGLEGFLPSSKIEPGVNYQPGQVITAIVDNIDKSRHRINLSPFITSTAGLIYK